MVLGYGMSDGEAILSFGKYKGQSIAEVPKIYLRYLSEAPWFEEEYPELQEAVNAELAFREHTQVRED